MPNKLLLTLLSLLPFAAGCADHSGTFQIADGPASPINEPDTNLLPPPGQTGTAQDPNEQTQAPQGQGTSEATSGGEAGESAGSGNGSGTAGSNHGGGLPGNNPGSGGQGGSPVPEPGTLLLFGSGLVGLAGASMRRRRRRKA